LSDRIWCRGEKVGTSVVVTGLLKRTPFVSLDVRICVRFLEGKKAKWTMGAKTGERVYIMGN